MWSEYFLRSNIKWISLGFPTLVSPKVEWKPLPFPTWSGCFLRPNMKRIPVLFTTLLPLKVECILLALPTSSGCFWVRKMKWIPLPFPTFLPPKVEWIPLTLPNLELSGKVSKKRCLNIEVFHEMDPKISIPSVARDIFLTPWPPLSPDSFPDVIFHAAGSLFSMFCLSVRKEFFLILVSFDREVHHCKFMSVTLCTMSEYCKTDILHTSCW